MTAQLQITGNEGLLLVERARDLLAKASTVDEAKEIRDKAAAVALYLRSRGASESNVRYATKARLWAERRIGELTRQLPKASKSAAGRAGARSAHGLAGDTMSPARTKATALEAEGVTKKQAQRFVAKLLRELGKADEACVLLNNATETVWGQSVAKRVSAVCFLAGRLAYMDEDGQPAKSPLQGQAVYYLGAAPGKFVEVFSKLGTCWVKPDGIPF